MDAKWQSGFHKVALLFSLPLLLLLLLLFLMSIPPGNVSPLPVTNTYTVFIEKLALPPKCTWGGGLTKWGD